MLFAGQHQAQPSKFSQLANVSGYYIVGNSQYHMLSRTDDLG